MQCLWCSWRWQFFSVALSTTFLSSQLKSSFLKYLFNRHLFLSLMHIIKAISHDFKQIANAVVHSCKWLCSLHLSDVSYIINCLRYRDKNVLYWFCKKVLLSSMKIMNKYRRQQTFIKWRKWDETQRKCWSCDDDYN